MYYLWSLAEIFSGLLNLYRQFTSGSQHQDNWAISTLKVGLGINVDHTRKQVGQGLTRTRLGNAHSVQTG